jgi:hypothetical protein
MPRYRCLIEYEATHDQDAQLRAATIAAQMGAGLIEVIVQGWQVLRVPAAVLPPTFEGPVPTVPEEAPWDQKA